MSEDPDMIRDLLGELFARMANVEKLAIKNTEALITFLPSDASSELMKEIMAFNQALQGMPVHQAQRQAEKRVLDSAEEARAKRH